MRLDMYINDAIGNEGLGDLALLCACGFVGYHARLAKGDSTNPADVLGFSL
jgi:hypothetical protein